MNNDRDTTEKRILDKMKEIMDIWHDYDPDGRHLSMFIAYAENGNGNDDGAWDSWYLEINNNYWAEDKEHPLDRTGGIDIGGAKWEACSHEPDDMPGVPDWWEKGAVYGQAFSPD